MPRDQVEQFLLSGSIPLPAMMPFHAAARAADREDGPDEVAIGGSRGPGKSYAAMAQAGIDDCQRVPGLKVLFLRKVQKSATESLDDLTRKVFAGIEHTTNNDGVQFPRNDSRILVGGYNDAHDIDKYLGIEYDEIVIEEATQLIEDKMQKIRGSLRSTKPNWRARLYLTTNADGPGLLWFKKRYVIPQREGKEKWTRFFPVSYKQNPFLAPEYVRWLEGLTGPLGKAWRDADWDAFAGMAFPNWNHERHVVNPFPIPDEWMRWRATDEGYAAPFCTLWAAKNPHTRQIVVYREAYQAGLTLKQQAELITDMTPATERITIHFGDPAMWQTKNMQGKTFSAADEYKAGGIYLTKADNERIQGKYKVDQALADMPNGEPGVVFFSTCDHIIEQLSTLARDPLKPEDVDTEAEDHAYDALRYLLTNQRKTTPEPAKTEQRYRHPGRGVKGI
jgi:hypothetical protein